MMMMEEKAAVQLRGLGKSYRPGSWAVCPADGELSGGAVGLLGPNGAGKTTFLSMLTLFLEPSVGDFLFFGIPARCAANHRALREQIGVLPQEVRLPSRQRVGALLAETLELRPCAGGLTRAGRGKRVRDMLEKLHLGEAAGLPCGALSGGMARRFALAMALIGEPRFLAVDEPTTGLDPEERLIVRRIFFREAERGLLLLSTHLTADIEAVCNDVWVLSRGRFAYRGPIDRFVAEESGLMGKALNLEEAYIHFLYRIGDPAAGRPFD
jgi:ABC-2 type transport system ATP-binding protein